MIRVTIELLPFGSDDPAHIRHLGTMTIANDGSGDEDTGHYNVRLSKWGQPKQSWRIGRVENFPRILLGPYDLMFRALKNIVGERNAQ